MKRTPRLSIVIPVFNQAATLGNTVGDLRRILGRLHFWYEIIIVDDASDDETEQVGRKLASRADQVRYIRLEESEGLANALKRGIGMVTGELVFLTAGDGTYRFNDLKGFMRLIEKYDMVLGYRDSRAVAASTTAMRLRRLLLKWLYGFELKEPCCGFQLIRREVLREISLYGEGDVIRYELLLRSIRAGFTYREVPVQSKGAGKAEGVGGTIRIVRELSRLYPKVGKIRSRRRDVGDGRIRRYIRRQWRLMLDRPLEASLDISGRCDLQCVSCSLWTEPNRGERDTAFWVNVLDDLQRLGVQRVILIGAEPLMRVDIGRIARAISIRGMGVTVFTNGMRLPEVATELVASGLDRLVLSLDGPEAAVHDGLRGGGGAFDAAIKGMKKVIQSAKDLDVPIPEIVFHTTVSIANAHVIPDMFRFAYQQDAGLTLQSVCQIPTKEVNKTRYAKQSISSRQYMVGNDDLLLSREEALKLKRRIRHNMFRRNNLSAKVLLSLSDEHLVEGTIPVIPCGHVHHTISVSAQGMVYPCGMLSKYHYGSLEDESVWAVWKGERRRNFLGKLKQDAFPVCKYCCHYLNNLTPGQVVRVVLGLTLHR